MKRTQYDIDSDQRIDTIRFALTELDRDAEGRIKAEADRYSYADLVVAILKPGVTGATAATDENWVDRIRTTLHTAIHTDGVTAGEALAGLGRLLSSAGNKIVRDERSNHQEST